ncbi:putative glycosyltransferase EpsJ [Muribaculaceae bacterium]|nr:putative glycosyltransferase EpsJ [Muribaculaceae bacterium]GFI57704.1 putative glycosyltransferase EpsJ [Muribaculaceae bacterium]
MDKILTIIIPTYNMESLLPRCLDSLVKPQCSEFLEVLVINDGSKDNSLSIARKYESEYTGIIKAVDKENGNYGSAVNKGIELATGKYFRILDADDYYDNKGLSILINELENINVDLILTNYRKDRGAQKVYFKSPESSIGHIYDFDNVDIDSYPNFAMHGITYKTSILKNNNIRLQHGISYTDTEYCFYPLSYVKTFVALDILVYCYQLGRPGQTVEISSQIKSVASMVNIIDRMYYYLKDNNIEERLFKKLRSIFCNINGLCFMTILCFDGSEKNMTLLGKLRKQIDDISGAQDIMLGKNLFGVRYYKSYMQKKKKSNGLLYSFYYKLVKKGVALSWAIRDKVFKNISHNIVGK